MKKLLVSLIAASAMLASSHIHAMAGYSFHFDASKPSWAWRELLQPDRFYTEHIQSKDKQPNPEYVEEIFKMKKVMGIKTPIIVKNENTGNPRGLASTTNYLFYSRLRLNENALSRESAKDRAYDNTQTLAHELTHIKNKDHHLQWSLVSLQDGLDIAGNAALCSASLSLLSRTKRSLIPLALIAGFTTKFASQEIIKKIDDTIDALEPQSDQEALKQLRERELAAEKGSYETLAQCGYCEAIRRNLMDFERGAQGLLDEGKTAEEVRNFRPAKAYPTMKEYLTFQLSALENCNPNVDPSTTQNTPNLTRNGSPTKSCV